MSVSVMAQQLYLFAGEDSYRLDREISRWTQGFEDKHGQGSVLFFRGERDASEVLSQLQGGGLFVQQRMIVITDIPKDTQSGVSRASTEREVVMQQLQRLYESWPEDLRVLCISHKPDKRTSDYKWFKKEADIKTYDLLTPAKLRSRLRSEYPDLLTSDQYDQLIAWVGTDTRRVLSEIDKISRWMRAHDRDRVSDEELRMLASGESDADTFAFVHLLCRDDVTAAIGLVDAVRASGIYRAIFWGSATWGLRLLIPMIEGVEQGMDSKQLAKALKAPPFGVAKLMKLAQSELDRDGGERVRGFFGEMLRIEYAVKSGALTEEEVRGQLKAAIAEMSR